MRYNNEDNMLIFDEGEAEVKDGCLYVYILGQKAEVTDDGTDSKTDEVL